MIIRANCGLKMRQKMVKKQVRLIYLIPGPPLPPSPPPNLKSWTQAESWLEKLDLRNQRLDLSEFGQIIILPVLQQLQQTDKTMISATEKAQSQFLIKISDSPTEKRILQHQCYLEPKTPPLSKNQLLTRGGFSGFGGPKFQTSYRNHYYVIAHRPPLRSQSAPQARKFSKSHLYKQFSLG